MSQSVSRDPARVHVGLMLALTAATGIVDAAGFLGLNRVFTGNITGSVVILGMGLAGAGGLPVAGPAVALLSFLVGALVAGRVLRPIESGWTSRSTMLFGAVGVSVLLVALLVFLTDRSPSGALALGVTAVLAVAMGVQIATARQLSVADVNTAVVTVVVASLAADSRLGRGRSQRVLRRVVAVAALGLGALLGAFAFRFNLGVPLLLAGAVILGVALGGHLTGRTAPS